LEFLKIQKKPDAILCGQICPEVFVVTDQSGIIEGGSFEGYELQIKEAAECCPAEVIRYQQFDHDRD